MPKLLKFVNSESVKKSALHIYEYGDVFVIERKDGLWGVMNKQGDKIVDFGKYDLIEPFFMGLSRVKIGSGASGLKENYGVNKWGIINILGEEVVPVEYDEIWQFHLKHKMETTVTKNHISTTIRLKDIAPAPYNLETDPQGCILDAAYYDELRELYADDGYPDAFEDDPDAVWNID